MRVFYYSCSSRAILDLFFCTGSSSRFSQLDDCNAILLGVGVVYCGLSIRFILTCSSPKMSIEHVGTLGLVLCEHMRLGAFSITK